MNIIQGWEAWWSATEADVLSFITKVKAGIVHTEQELAYVLSWLSSHAGQINAGIQELNGALSAVMASGLIKQVPPQLSVAIADANKGIAALNALSAGIQAGTATAQVVVDTYSALKSAQSSTALATLAVVNAPPAVAPVP